MEDKDNLLDIEMAIVALPEKSRAILALWAAGYRQSECGEIVGLSRAAVGIALKKAHQALKRMVE